VFKRFVSVSLASYSASGAFLTLHELTDADWNHSLRLLSDVTGEAGRQAGMMKGHLI